MPVLQAGEFTNETQDTQETCISTAQASQGACSQAERVLEHGLSPRGMLRDVADNLYNGQKLRCLTIVDNHTRISPAIGAGFRYTACSVVETLNLAVAQYGKPACIRVDNGPEFIFKELDLWAYARGVQLDFSRPGKPTDNAFIESFDSRFRQECLNQHWFLSLEDAQEKIESWPKEYNEARPHRKASPWGTAHQESKRLISLQQQMA